MRLYIKVEADDEAAALYIEKLWAEYADDGVQAPTPQEWLRDRLQEFVEDEMAIAFMFARQEVPMEFEVVDEP